MKNLLSWFKSTRSIIAVLFGIGLHIALLNGILTGDQYMTLAAVVIGSYFGRKDTPEEQGK